MKKEMMALLLTLIFVTAIGIFADQSMAETKNVRSVGQFSKVEFMPVGDVEGHLFIIGESRGLNFVDGEVAVFTGWVQCDTIKGIGPCKNYVKSVYQDGSVTITKGQMKLTISQDGKTGLYEDYEGEFIMGTGRFAGIKGSFSYKGKRVTPISPGLKETRGDFFIEGTMTYTLPPK